LYVKKLPDYKLVQAAPKYYKDRNRWIFEHRSEFAAVKYLNTIYFNFTKIWTDDLYGDYKPEFYYQKVHDE
jgi:hypothetical protein